MHLDTMQSASLVTDSRADGHEMRKRRGSSVGGNRPFAMVLTTDHLDGSRTVELKAKGIEMIHRHPGKEEKTFFNLATIGSMKTRIETSNVQV